MNIEVIKDKAIGFEQMKTLTDDMPETDALLKSYGDDNGGLVPQSFARKLERERDEARMEIVNVAGKLAGERDALRAEVERLETLYEAMKREKNDYQAQRDNIRLEADQLSTELHLERFSLKEMNAEVERLKADKARLDWLESNSHEWDILLNGKTVANSLIREAIDAAMKEEL